MMSQSPNLVYKITTPDLWAQAQQDGALPDNELDAKDGYVHLSTRTQLPETLRLHFAGQRDLVILAVRTHSLGAMLKWEPSRGGDLFPHLYGPLAFTAVEDTITVDVAADGSVDLARLPE